MKARTHLVVLSLEDLCIPAPYFAAKYFTYGWSPYTHSTVKDIMSFPVGIMVFFGLGILTYAFAIQFAFLAKKLSWPKPLSINKNTDAGSLQIVKRTSQQTLKYILAAFLCILVFIISLLFYGFSCKYFGGVIAG